MTEKLIEIIKCTKCLSFLRKEYLGAHCSKHECLNCNYLIVEDGGFILIEKLNIRLYSSGEVFEMPSYKLIFSLSKKIDENNALKELEKVIDNLIFV